MRRCLLAPLALLLVAGCGGSTSSAMSTATRAVATTSAPRLTDRHRCPDARAFSCSTLTVPLDRARPDGPKLRLKVAVQRVAHAPRGVLVQLTGGPGQPGVSFAKFIAKQLGAAARGYRLVFYDQRGTGGTALNCPALQREVGSSDLTVAKPSAIAACARRLGDARAHYTTADTVADMDDLRTALHAPKLALDGVSYGTFTAERYALAHPDRVDRLVLDSVVEQRGIDPLVTDVYPAVARVLRLVCRETACEGDPVADLAKVVARDHDGVAILDTLTSLSIGKQRLSGIPGFLRLAAKGRTAPLRKLIAGVHRDQRTRARDLSQGLHTATLCAELRAPWGPPNAALAGRREALAGAADALGPQAFAPFDRATAIGNGLADTCVQWPPVDLPQLDPGGDLPAVPVLLLAGDHDLSTPLVWAQRELARAPQGKLVIIRGAGHSVQSRTNSKQLRRVLKAFLQG